MNDDLVRNVAAIGIGAFVSSGVVAAIASKVAHRLASSQDSELESMEGGVAVAVPMMMFSKGLKPTAVNVESVAVKDKEIKSAKVKI